MKKNSFYIKVKVIPKSPKTELVEQMDDGTYKVRVKAPPEGGKANAELEKFLKKHFKASMASIISGQTSRVKLVKIQ